MDVNFHHLPRLYFLHILKCAGTSFRLWLNSLFDTAEFLEAHQPQDLERLSANGLPDRKFYSGHFGWRLMEIAAQSAIEVVPLTILRSPEAMYQSLWRYIPLIPESEIRKFGPVRQHNIRSIANQIGELTAESDYAMHSAFWNMAVKFLAKDGPLCECPADVDKETFEIAKAHLRQMPFFGMSEDWERSSILFADAFKLPLRGMNRFDNARPGAGKIGLPAGFSEAIRSLCAFDFDMHEFAQRLFTERFEQTAAKFGIDPEAPAESFKAPLKEQFLDAGRLPGRARVSSSSRVLVSNGIITEGFLHRYPHVDESWRLWGGPEAESAIYLPLDRSRELQIELTFAVFLTAGMHSQLEIAVDNIPVERSIAYRAGPDGAFSTVVSFPVRPFLDKKAFRYTTIGIRVPEVVYVDNPAFKSNVSFALGGAIIIKDGASCER